jgi:hypothetical protein
MSSREGEKETFPILIILRLGRQTAVSRSTRGAGREKRGTPSSSRMERNHLNQGSRRLSRHRGVQRGYVSVFPVLNTAFSCLTASHPIGLPQDRTANEEAPNMSDAN